MKKPVEKKRDLSWLFVLLLFLGVLILLFSQNEVAPPGDSAADFSAALHSPEKVQRVNKHLKETAISLEKERLQRMLETSKELQTFSNSYHQDSYQRDSRLTFETDPNMLSLTRELSGSRALDDSQLTPEQIIQKKLYENEGMQKADQAYREQYAAQFIENARRAGWAIELSPDFEVLSVRKIPNRIRQPTQLFDSGSAGSR